MRKLALFCAVGISMLSGCAVLDSHNVIGRMTPPPEVVGALSPAQRLQVIEDVWTTINTRHVDEKLNGVDWAAVRTQYAPKLASAKDDEAFWEVLNLMVGELKDSHTRVESPARVLQRQENGGLTYGLSVTKIGEGYFVSGVNSDSDAWFSGMRLGMQVHEMNNESIAQLFARTLTEVRQQSTRWTQERTALSKMFEAREKGTLAIKTSRADGSEMNVTLKPRRVISPPSAHIRTLPSGFGYIRFSGFSESLRGRVMQGLDELKDTPGLIVDLRGNGGGSGAFAVALVSRFMKDAATPFTILTRNLAPVRVLGINVSSAAFSGFKPFGAGAYTKPVVVLTDSNSASASEMTAGGLRALGNATIVGQTTCGCLLGFMGYLKLLGGAELAYSEVGFRMNDGKRIEGEGLVPDILVAPSIEALRAQRDVVLETAVATLERKTQTVKP